MSKKGKDRKKKGNKSKGSSSYGYSSPKKSSLERDVERANLVNSILSGGMW